MYLLIDIGNTDIVLGIYCSDNLLYRWRIDTDKRRTREKYVHLIQKFLADDGIDSSLLAGSVISSVVPCLTPVFQYIAQKLTGRKGYLVDYKSFPGMKIRTDLPSQVGTDRLANAFAGYELFKTSLIIVDCGTATNFDVVSAEGEFLGGVISPGILLSLEALIQKTSKLPNIRIEPPNQVIGKNTVECMQSGIIFGYAGMVDSLVRRIEEELGQSSKVIATGGLAETVHTASTTIEAVIEDLTLKGLYYISKNMGKNRLLQRKETKLGVLGD